MYSTTLFKTLTITNDTKQVVYQLQVSPIFEKVQSLSYCYFTYFKKLLVPRGRNAADQAPPA